MDLQRLSEACFASPIDLFHPYGDELVRDLQQRCLAAVADATGLPAERWQPGAVDFHRSSNAAVADVAAGTTGWVERISDDGSFVFRVTAASPTGVERIDASIAFDVAGRAAWCDCVAASATAATAAGAIAPARPRTPARRRMSAGQVTGVRVVAAAH